MARFSARTGRWHGLRRANTPLPETQRDEREWRTELPGGLTRTDYGAPIPRLPCEPQPVSVGRPSEEPRATPQPAPAVAPDATPSPAAIARRRNHRAITREP